MKKPAHQTKLMAALPSPQYPTPVVPMREHQQAPAPTLLRIRGVLSRFPVSRATWYAGIKAGRYPAPVSMGPRAVAWRSSDIDALIANAK